MPTYIMNSFGDPIENFKNPEITKATPEKINDKSGK